MDNASPTNKKKLVADRPLSMHEFGHTKTALLAEEHKSREVFDSLREEVPTSNIAYPSGFFLKKNQRETEKFKAAINLLNKREQQLNSCCEQANEAIEKLKINLKKTATINQ